MDELFTQKEREQVTAMFVQMGAAPDQAEVMSAQLLKRASQIAHERDISGLEALQSLMGMIITAREGGDPSGIA